MGGGIRSSGPPKQRKSGEEHSMKRVPHEKPPFSLSQLKKTIPPHCFQRSLFRSFSYILLDLSIAWCLAYVAINYFFTLPYKLSLLAWPLYWIMSGCILFRVWQIAHECAHHAFSDHQWLDDLVGFVLHSFLLTPYFSWKYSHRRHHSNTGSLERDEMFVPKTKSRMIWYYKYLNNPPGRVLTLATMLTLGWPLYLAFNVSGRPYDGFACHYNPYGPIYSHHERLQVYISDVGILAVCYALYKLLLAKGLLWVIFVYGVPLLVSNGFLVLTTFLQHIHPAVPHYDSSEWDWLRGSLVTVDRDYGILNKVFHNITDTHVAHHLFTTIPHYHTMEATIAIKPVLGDYYHFDGTPVYKALWRETKECMYVETDEGSNGKGVYWYKNNLE